MLRKNIAAGEIPGAVLLIARKGKIAYFESLGLFGSAGQDGDAQRRAVPHLFDVEADYHRGPR